jgi:putative oxygen-independent coproporphyrinogen III oxidase
MKSLPLLLYVHIPWCVRKCPYCDFNSHQRQGELPVDAYLRALMHDLSIDAPYAQDRHIESVFFGGGTPSLFAPEAIDRILQGASQYVHFADNVEITLETNPGTVEHGRFDLYRAAGVNRLSFGVQSFNDQALQRIGRIHNGQEADRAIRKAQDQGISNINIDLMYALPLQTQEQALHDLELAINLNPTHISHYQLTLEPNTQFAKTPPSLPDHDTAWAMQEACEAVLAQHAFGHYEVSAYARDGFFCRHNVGYWKFADYLGIGAGAHGKLTMPDGQVLRTCKKMSPRHYLEHAENKADMGTHTIVASEQLPFEFMLNHLRLYEGFNLTEFETTTGLSRQVIATKLTQAKQQGWLQQSNDFIETTELGRRFLNDVLALFLRE